MRNLHLSTLLSSAVSLLARPWAVALLVMGVLSGPACQRDSAEYFILPDQFRGYLGPFADESLCFVADSTGDTTRICMDYYSSSVEQVEPYATSCHDKRNRASENVVGSLNGSVGIPGIISTIPLNLEMVIYGRDHRSYAFLRNPDYGIDTVFQDASPVIRLDGARWLTSDDRLISVRYLSDKSENIEFQTLSPSPGLPLEEVLVIGRLSAGKGLRSMLQGEWGVRELHLSRRYGVLYLDLVYADYQGHHHPVVLRRLF